MRAEETKRRRRSKEEERGARATSGVIPISQKLISMEGRLKGGEHAWRALSRAHEANRKAANEEEPGGNCDSPIGTKGGDPVRKTGPEEISESFRGFSREREKQDGGGQVRVIGGDR